ncbi:MAG: Thiamine-phosphate synthase [Rhodocyclaceae bacterium]|nr:Thiamine-phosphate synthase [Rhodocyclaceae bacterium]
MPERLPRRGLYAITPDGLSGARLLSSVEAALAGGVRLIQYRDKGHDPVQRFRDATGLAERCRRYGACFIINDDIELAIRVAADGVHLGRDDAAIGEARAHLAPGSVIGASCYADLARASHALAAGADYLAFGAVCTSRTKPDATPVTLPLLREAASRFTVPIAAIGGIDLARASDVLATGVSLLAVCDDLFSADDVREQARRYTRLFQGPI